MGFLRKAFATTVLGLGLLFGSTFSQATTQLGFLLDASGSISAANYDLLRTGLNAALAGLPVDGSIEITIVSFGSGSSHRRLADDPDRRDATDDTIRYYRARKGWRQHRHRRRDHQPGGPDDGFGGIFGPWHQVDHQFGHRRRAQRRQPQPPVHRPGGCSSSVSAGIDALSIEAIGAAVSSPSALSNMALIAFPATVSILPLNSTTIPNPISGSFVVPVSDFDALAPVLLAKVQAAVVQVPEPGSLVLIAIALLGFAASRRGKRSSSQRQFA